MKKLLICPWFGPFPEWFNKYQTHIEFLKKYGYDFLFPTDLEDFKARIKDKLGIEATIISGTSDPHNFRVAYGLLFAKELAGYDYWGITDLDCVYGKIDDFMPDENLAKLDIWSNHHNYICGPWTLFKNTETVNNLFRDVANWRELMSDRSVPGRWTENEFTEIVDQVHREGKINQRYTFWQGHDVNDDSEITFDDGKLFDHGDEIMMFHFNRHKRWPLR